MLYYGNRIESYLVGDERVYTVVEVGQFAWRYHSELWPVSEDIDDSRQPTEKIHIFKQCPWEDDAGMQCCKNRQHLECNWTTGLQNICCKKNWNKSELLA